MGTVFHQLRFCQRRSDTNLVAPEGCRGRSATDCVFLSHGASQVSDLSARVAGGEKQLTFRSFGLVKSSSQSGHLNLV